jgi:hypothetical protein
LLALLALAAGCSDAPRASRPDSGVDLDAAGEPSVPAPPAPPVLTPCPAGWREVDEVCEPWPESGRADCAPDEAHFPGGAGCERVGTACGADEWATDLPGSGVWFVRAGEPDGGDGSRAAPFDRIADAVRAAAPGDVIALSKGVFDQVVFVDVAVEVRGACVGETTVASSNDAFGATLVLGAGASASNLTVSGERDGVQVTGAGAALRSVVVGGAARAGVAVVAGRLDATDLVVRETRRTPDGLLGDGLIVTAGEAVLDRAVFDRNTTTGIFADGAGSRVAANDVAIVDTRADGAGGFGYGALAEDGATVTIERGVVDGFVSAGVSASAGTIAATDVVLRFGLGIEGGGGRGHGVYAWGGGSATIERAWIARNRGAGVRVWDEGTTLVLADVIVEDTEPWLEEGIGDAPAVERGYGVEVTDAATATVRRAVLDRNAVAGLRVSYGATVDAADLVVRRGEPDSEGFLGAGVVAVLGGAIDLTRAGVDANRLAGVLAFSGGRVDAVDLAVTGTVESACAADACADAPGGTGLFAIHGGSIAATRFASNGNALCGVQVAADGAVDLYDGVVSGNLVGANVQSEDFDLSRLQRGVVYRDNGRNLDAAALPLPDVAGLGG